MNYSPSPALIALCLTAAASLIFSQAVAAEPAPASTLITGATIFDGTSEKLITGKSVLIEGHGDFRSNVDGHPYFAGAAQGGHVNQWKHTLIADGVDDVRRAVREQLFRGASQINGDPTKDIRLLMDTGKNIDLIMKDGKIYKNWIQ